MDIQWDLGLPMLSQVATVLPIVSSRNNMGLLGRSVGNRFLLGFTEKSCALMLNNNNCSGFVGNPWTSTVRFLFHNVIPIIIEWFL